MMRGGWSLICDPWWRIIVTVVVVVVVVVVVIVIVVVVVVVVVVIAVRTDCHSLTINTSAALLVALLVVRL